MDKPDKSIMLRRAAQRASQRPFFVASALSVYRQIHRCSEPELATFLGCTPADLAKLALCRLPDAEAPSFRQEVERIASYAGVHSMQLVHILRDVASTAALREALQRPHMPTGQGVLMAARDRPADAQTGKAGPVAASRNNDTESHEP